MKNITFICILLVNSMAFGQVTDTLTLEDCYQLVARNYPLVRQKALLPVSSELKIKNLGTNYLPQLFLNGQASYQSDVTEIPIKLPLLTIPQISRDMYKISLDVNQVLYDGGNTKTQKAVETSSLQVDQQNYEVEMYKLKDRINQLYFSILLLQENEKLLALAKDDLNSKLNKVLSGIKNGTLLSVNADVLKAELIKLDQELIEVDQNKQTTFEMLSVLTGKPVSSNSLLILPQINAGIPETIVQRFEYQWFDAQKQRIDVMKSGLQVRTLPKISFFGQLGYGRPGLNMLKNDFTDFYVVGARLNWNLWNWNLNQRERQIFDLQKDQITIQKDVFNKNLDLSLKKELGDIRKLQELMGKDQEIIEMRANIVKTYASQLENGTITSTEYVTELNNETQARLNLENHKIQQLKARINYLNLIGKQ